MDFRPVTRGGIALVLTVYGGLLGDVGGGATGAFCSAFVREPWLALSDALEDVGWCMVLDIDWESSTDGSNRRKQLVKGDEAGENDRTLG